MTTSGQDLHNDPHVHLLRHSLATLAYRCGKTLRDAPDGFATLRIGESTRTPGEILAHISDTLHWTLWLIRGEHKWKDSAPLPWEQEVARFFAALRTLDDHLASGAGVQCPVENLFQGPVADMFTHVGQLAMLRRIAGSPVRGESYYRADIEAGRVGSEQSPPRRELD